MERLTFLDNGKPAFRIRDCVYKNAIANKLSAYEDTGLEPEEIETIQAENAKLRELLKLAKAVPPLNITNSNGRK